MSEENPLEVGKMISIQEKFDELQVSAEKLVALLKDRQPGVMTWNQILHERMQELKKLLVQAIG